MNGLVETLSTVIFFNLNGPLKVIQRSILENSKNNNKGIPGERSKLGEYLNKNGEQGSPNMRNQKMRIFEEFPNFSKIGEFST